MWKVIYKPILVILITIIFFLSYNKFLLDRSLEDLKFSLDIISNAESTEEAGNVKTILELLLVNKVTSKEFDPAELAVLEYAHSVMTKGEEVSSRELKDAAISVKQIVEQRVKEREIQRGRVVMALDSVSKGVTKSIDNLRTLPATLVSKEEEGEEIDTKLLTEAKSYDKEWKLSKAKEAYEKLIAEYPDYKEIKFLKLRLAYIYQKIGLYEKAEKLFNTIVREYSGTLEAKTAEKLLSSLKEIKRLAVEKETLLKRIQSIVSKDKLQEAYFDLGTISIRLLDFIIARQAFEKVIEIDPSNKLAIKAKFNLAWSYKFQDKMDESISTFEELIQKHPDAELALNAKYQLADTYRRQGNYEEAIAKYKEIANEYKDSQIAPVALLQASATYLYDIGDADKAKKEFLNLKENYPDAAVVRPESEYVKEVMPEKVVPEGWLDFILVKGATGFADTVLDISRGKSLGTKTPYEKIYGEKDMNEIVIKMLDKIGLKHIVTDTHVNFKQNKIEGSAMIRWHKLSVKASGIVMAEAVRGGFKFTVEKYKFTLGNSNIPVPIPRAIVDNMIQRLNETLTRKNLFLSVEELELTEHKLTIKGFRY